MQVLFIEMIAKSRASKEKQVYSGFIAQDVEKAAQSVGYDFSGIDAPENGKGAYGLRYAEFVVPLVKAVQELSEQNDRLQAQIKQIAIAQRGEDSQWISGSELTAGIYLYALIVDGKEVDTKRMILTKQIKS